MGRSQNTQTEHRRSQLSWTDPGHRQAVWSVVALTLVGLVFRLISINSRGLWLDEAITVYQAQLSFSDLVQTMAGGVHPPLFHILMHLWASVFGTTEVAVRGFALVWGTLAIPASYWATRALFDRRTSLIAALMTTVSPYFIWYSQEARMYSMMLFFGFMSIGFYARAVGGNRKRDWLGYTAFTFLGMFTHYFFAFLVMGEVLHFVVVKGFGVHHRLKCEGRSKARWSKPLAVFSEIPELSSWLLSMLFLGSTYLLWLSRSLFFYASDNALVASATGQGLGYGQTAPSLAFRFNDVGRVVAEMLVGFQPENFTFALVATWPLIITAILMLFDHMEDLARRASVMLWSSVGLVVIAMLGQWQGQVLASRYFIAAATPTVVLIAAVLRAMPARHRRLTIIVALAVCFAAWVSQSYNPDNAIRFEYREAFEQIADEYQAGDVVVYEPFYLEPVVTYYLPETIPSFGFPRYGEFGYVRRAKVEIGEDLVQTTDLSKRVWLVLSFQDIATARGDAYNTMMWFERNGFTTVKDEQLNRVRVILYDSPDAGPPIDLMEEVAP